MLKPYFLTTKSNLMTKFKLSGKSMLMALSFFAFMILGSVSASAQWVTPTEAVVLLKQEIETLENDFAQATNDTEKYNIALELRYFKRVFFNVTDGGLEVPQSVEQARPEYLPTVHSSGLVYGSNEDPNFKTIAQALVDAGTDLLSD